MGINHTEPGYTEKAAPFIQEFGGKIGGLKFIQETCRKLSGRVLPAVIMRPGENWDGACFDANIVRSSHPHDFQGLVDVIETEVIKSDRSQDIGDTIERMRWLARTNEIMKYARYENPDYDGKVTIGIQPYNGAKRGSVVEHPNQPGKYLVTRITGKGRNAYPSVGIYDQQGDLQSRVNLRSELREREMPIVEMYQIIQRAGLVRDDLSFQVEFGGDDFDDPALYQVRAFIRKQIADFRLEEDQHSDHLVFGVTSETGMALPYVMPDSEFFSSFPSIEPDVPWALFKKKHQHERDLSFQPKRMKAYLAGRFYGSGTWASLEHGHFSLAQKADVTVFETLDGGFQPLIGHKPQNLRIICDGYQAQVNPV